ncbi:hypothetical protein B0F90DRAFT_1919965 [Multifurca ochricompacta]|uniref:Protein kinase domain-containing protein n=1 Tax=Multifurca ochricompacta TaxID=376703 RepID=A0AAD4LZ57_9AGAM|nr:hypothetical protein B0F90DRAFT_1919965 [Multifurca ochricompacta]
MILQAACLARLGNQLCANHSDPVVITAIYIDSNPQAHEYLARSNVPSNDISIHLPVVQPSIESVQCWAPGLVKSRAGEIDEGYPPKSTLIDRAEAETGFRCQRRQRVIPEEPPSDRGLTQEDNCLVATRVRMSVEPLKIKFLEGVAFLHEDKIAHLDLKPDNVVIDVEGDKRHLRLWVIDFRLSVFVEKGTRYSPILADRWACGRMLDYFKEHLSGGDGSRRDIGRLRVGPLSEDPRSGPSVKEVLDGCQGKAKDETMKRSTGEDWTDGLEMRARISCVDNIVD